VKRLHELRLRALNPPDARPEPSGEAPDELHLDATGLPFAKPHPRFRVGDAHPQHAATDPVERPLGIARVLTADDGGREHQQKPSRRMPCVYPRRALISSSRVWLAPAPPDKRRRSAVHLELDPSARRARAPPPTYHGAYMLYAGAKDELAPVEC
jgi:hypothetical protein